MGVVQHVKFCLLCIRKTVSLLVLHVVFRGCSSIIQWPAVNRASGKPRLVLYTLKDRGSSILDIPAVNGDYEKYSRCILRILRHL